MILKLEKYIFYIFLFAIPFQARKILWYSDWRFNEWQAVSMYITDVLLVLLFGFWAFNFFFSHSQIRNLKSEIRNKSKTSKSKFLNPDIYLVLFIVVSAISIKNSSNYIVSAFYWIKLVEFALFYWYLSRYAFNKFGLFNSFLIIFLSGFFQAVVAVIQFIKQSNIGLEYLGESIFNLDMPGVASFYLPAGEKIIRAYGMTPHPNILAGFLFLALFAFYFIYLYSRLHSEHESFVDAWDKFMLIAYGIMLIAFFATFSRVIVFIWFLSFCLRAIIIRAFRHYRLIFGTKEGRKRIKAILLTNLLIIVIFGAVYSNEILGRLTIASTDQAIELRSFYTEEALSINLNYMGVGIGNFVNWLASKNPFLPAYAYQPVHNIYLLIYSETGIIGITTFIIFLIFVLKDFILKTRLKKSYQFSALFLFGSFLFIGFFDHFLWTLQQGRLIFWTGLGLLTFLANSDKISLVKFEKEGYATEEGYQS